MANSVDDETDLSTLVGDNGEFQRLVEAKFRTEFGNVTWQEAKVYTVDKFLDEYAAGSSGVRIKLMAWIAHYDLKERFKQPESSKRMKIHTGTDPMTPEIVAQPKRLSPIKKPIGDTLDLSSGPVLLIWLRSHMNDTTKLVPQPYLLNPANELKYSLQDRNEAMKEGRELLSTIFQSSANKVTSRANFPIPVCSAMSGIGKSRLLDEFVKLFLNDSTTAGAFPAAIPPSSRLALVLSYGNGHFVTKEEKSMGSAAAFAWRLLYAVFLDKNTSNLHWESFWRRLPANAADLTLDVALHVIAAAANAMGNNDGKPLAALFVGIDEFQLVPGNHVDDGDPLVVLLEALIAAMATAPSGVVILPMFAGTDWNKMSLAASSSSNGPMWKRAGSPCRC